MPVLDRLNQWWRAPRMRADEELERERKATWLELFFDLVFVVFVAELAHSLGGDPSWSAVGGFVLMFLAMWWVWIGSTYYNDRYETDDLAHRVFTFLLMVGVASMGFHVHGGLNEGTVGFAVSYVLARAINIYLWWRAGKHNPPARTMTNRFVTGFSISAALWTLSIFLPPPLRFYCWAAGLAFDIITPLTTVRAQAKLPALTTSHLPERFGVFVILVLREPIAGVIEGTSAASHHLTLQLAVDGFLGLLLAFLLWWIYFDQVANGRIRKSIWARLSWGYLHLPLIFSVTAIGAGLLHAYEVGRAPLPAPVYWLISGGVALFLVASALVEWTFEAPSEEKGRFWLLELAHWLSAVAVLGLGWAAPALTPAYFFALLLLFVAVPVVLELLFVEPEYERLSFVDLPSDGEVSALACAHKEDIRDVTPNSEGCEMCLKEGTWWVHLRICRVCGHVGCCDASPGQHAKAHYHETAHPVMQSFEAHEHWVYCYVDEEVVGEMDKSWATD